MGILATSAATERRRVTQYGRSINVPQWNGETGEAGEVWRLRKGRRLAVCSLWTHPMGREARVTVDGEWHRGEARRDRLALVDLAVEWRRRFQEKGWR